MFATATAHKQPLLGAIQGLKVIRRSFAFGQGRALTVSREEADLDRMSPHALDVLELLPCEGCVSDWGLIERSARLRSGWT